jgi:hypothetical protein
MSKTKALFKDADGNPYTEFSAAARMRKGAEGLLDILVYVPEHEDAEGDIASKEVIRDIAHNFIPCMEGSGIDLLHSLETLSPEDAHICETYIVQKSDPRFVDVIDDDGKPIDPEGSWGVTIKLDNPVIRSLYETDGWHGASMYGAMIVEPLTKSDFTAALASRLGTTPNSQENDMNEEKFAEMLKAFGVSLTSALAKSLEGLKPVTKQVDDPKPVADPKPAVIEFVGDAEKLEDIEAHEEKLFKAHLDFGKPEDLAKWKAYITKKAADAKAADGKGDGEGDDGKGETVELVKARQRVAELEKASKQDTKDVESGDSAETKMSKGRVYGRELAQRLMKAQNSHKYGRVVRAS